MGILREFGEGFLKCGDGRIPGGLDFAVEGCVFADV